MSTTELTATDWTSGIVLTRPDYQRLSAFAGSARSGFLEVSEALSLELERARIVESTKIPANVVTMNARVTVRDEQSGKTRTFTLVYPKEEDSRVGNLSVLTPAGVALLGLSAGDTATWTTRDGQTKRLTVCEVLYQPEADGRFDL